MNWVILFKEELKLNSNRTQIKFRVKIKRKKAFIRFLNFLFFSPQRIFVFESTTV